MDRKRTALAAAVVLALGFGMAGTAWAEDLTVGSGETRTVNRAQTVDSVKVSGDNAALHITSGGRVDVDGVVNVQEGSSDKPAKFSVTGGELSAHELAIATQNNGTTPYYGQLEVGPGGIVKITKKGDRSGVTLIGKSESNEKAIGTLTVKSGGRFESEKVSLVNGSFTSDPGSYVNVVEASIGADRTATLEGTTVIRTRLYNRSSQTLISHLVLGSSSVQLDGDKPLKEGSAIYLEGTALFDTAKPYRTLETGRLDLGQSQSGEREFTFDISNVPIDVSGLTVEAGEAEIGHLRPGETAKMTLLHYEAEDAALKLGTLRGAKSQNVLIGTTLHATGMASQDAEHRNDVIYTIQVANDLQPQTHSAVMAAAAGLSAVAGGADFISSAAATLAEEGFSTFAAAGGGEQRYDTGSHVTSHEWHGVVGVGAKNTSAAGGSAEYGLFYDYGNSRYSTYQSAGNGSGKAIYKGGGLFGKYTTPAGWYVEGSFRAGRVNNRADHLFRDGFGRGYDFKTDSPYYGFHAGLGKTIALGGADSLDVYGKYFYTHVGSDSFHAGGSYDMDSVESSLLRIGARWNHGVGSWTWYLGAAYEHEFDGEAKGTADGLPIRSADIGGSSARFELGTSYTTGKWILGASVEAYAGEHRGVSGHVSAGMKF